MLRLSLASLLLLFTLSACTPATPAAGPPADLHVRYDWRAGTMPPPYHYSYSISLQADGSGEVTMTPDYDGPAVPIWREPFSVTTAEVAQLYALMLEQGLLSQSWRADADPPVGGSSGNLTVQAAGRTVAIPPFLATDQQARAETMADALRALVPEPIFTDLEARRAEYVAEYTAP
jgi:hypothetical protein